MITVSLLEMAKGLRPCKKCGETGMNPNCDCFLFKTYWSTYSANVPLHDQHIRMDNIEPSNLSTLPFDTQSEIITKMRQYPDDWYCFFGPTGVGKTTFCVALYESVLAGNPKASQPGHTPFVWRVSAKLLMDQFVSYSTGRIIDGKPASEPLVNRRRILKARDAGYVPRLFLEEVDKVVMTQYKTTALWELYDAIYESCGQLVFNTNLCCEEFLGLFPQKDALTMGRRIAEFTVKHDTCYDFYRA